MDVDCELQHHHDRKRENGGSGDGHECNPLLTAAFVDKQVAKAYRFQFEWKHMLAFMGPGWVMSLAYLDPGNLEADLQQGAYTNVKLVWVLWWSTVMGLLLQDLSSRLSIVTGSNLAEMSRREYSRAKSFLVYLMMELAIVGSDIQEVVGSAIAFNVLFGWDLWVGCLVTGLDTFTVLGVHQIGVKYFEGLIIVLVLILSVCFLHLWGQASLPLGDTLYGWTVPELPMYAMMQAVGTLGAVIMPHNLYLHSGLVTTRNVNRSSYKAVADANKYNFLESSVALLASFFVNLAVVSTFAHSFYSSTCAHHSMACVPDVASDLDDASLAALGAACVSNAALEPGHCAEIG